MAAFPSPTLLGPIPCSEIPSSTENSTGPNGSPGTSSFVDSALCAALREPRERVALLRLEVTFMDFCKSSDEWLEVGGPYNSISVGPSMLQQRGGVLPFQNNAAATTGGPRQTSFQRCILHRLADRFGIVRSNGSLLEGSIRLIKVPETRIPSTLLIDLEPSEYMLPPQSTTDGVPGMTNALSQASLDSNNINTQQQQPPRKMKIMKRSDRSRSVTPNDKNGNSNNSKTLLQKNSSISDKEKAYAEARARIFSDESEAEGNSSLMDQQDVAPSAPAGGVAAAAELQSPPPRPPSNENSSSNSTLQSSANANKDNSSGISSSSTSLTLENKAVYRNRMEEAADPDFRRGVVVYPVYYPATVAGSNGTAAMYPPVQAPHQHFQQNAHYSPSPVVPPPANCLESFPPLAADAPAFYPSSFATNQSSPAPAAASRPPSAQYLQR